MQVFLKTFEDRATAHAVRLTLVTAAVAVPLNAVFGLFAAWAVTRFSFRGRSLLISLIDLAALGLPGDWWTALRAHLWAAGLAGPSFLSQPGGAGQQSDRPIPL